MRSLTMLTAKQNLFSSTVLTMLMLSTGVASAEAVAKNSASDAPINAPDILIRTPAGTYSTNAAGVTTLIKPDGSASTINDGQWSIQAPAPKPNPVSTAPAPQQTPTKAPTQLGTSCKKGDQAGTLQNVQGPLKCVPNSKPVVVASTTTPSKVPVPPKQPEVKPEKLPSIPEPGDEPIKTNSPINTPNVDKPSEPIKPAAPIKPTEPPKPVEANKSDTVEHRSKPTDPLRVFLANHNGVLEPVLLNDGTQEHLNLKGYGKLKLNGVLHDIGFIQQDSKALQSMAVLSKLILGVAPGIDHLKALQGASSDAKTLIADFLASDAVVKQIGGLNNHDLSALLVKNGLGTDDVGIIKWVEEYLTTHTLADLAALAIKVDDVIQHAFGAEGLQLI